MDHRKKLQAGATAATGATRVTSALKEIFNLLGHAAVETQRERRRRQGRIHELVREAAEEFGHAKGWKLSKRCFTLEQLAGCSRTKAEASARRTGAINITAHASFYRDPKGRPAAIAAHLYDWPDIGPEVEAACLALGLHYEAAADIASWWYPGVTQLVLYTRATPATKRKKKGVRCESQLTLPFE